MTHHLMMYNSFCIQLFLYLLGWNLVYYTSPAISLEKLLLHRLLGSMLLESKLPTSRSENWNDLDPPHDINMDGAEGVHHLKNSLINQLYFCLVGELGLFAGVPFTSSIKLEVLSFWLMLEVVVTQSVSPHVGTTFCHEPPGVCLTNRPFMRGRRSALSLRTS